MAWYPGARRMELQPESNAQAAIRPTQVIVHSIAGPWTAARTYEYWRDSTNLESHFGLGYAGDLAQYIGTETRADANAAANLRPDGSGAVSIETASNVQATDPWTDEQIEQLVGVGVWMHRTHGVPLRLCRTADDPGFGYHCLFTAWNPNAHACPGAARIAQFKEVVLPGIIARANGQTTEEDDVELTAEDLAKVRGIVRAELEALLTVRLPRLDDPTKTMFVRDHWRGVGVTAAVRASGQQTVTAVVNSLAPLIGTGVDTAAVVAACREAIASAAIDVDVHVHDDTGGN